MTFLKSTKNRHHTRLTSSTRRKAFRDGTLPRSRYQTTTSKHQTQHVLVSREWLQWRLSMLSCPTFLVEKVFCVLPRRCLSRIAYGVKNNKNRYGRTECFGSDFEVKDGDYILVGGDRGIDLGRVISWSSETPDAQHRTKKVIRFANEEDLHLYFNVIPEKERSVAVEANEVVARYGMRMSVVHAEFQFDMNKVTLHYSSTEPRIDWRPALAQLYRKFQCRLWFAPYNPQATPDANLPLPSPHTPQQVTQQ